MLLPMAQVGGDLIGAGLLTIYAVPGALAAASVIVDILVQAATQLLFAIIGLIVLVALGVDATLARIAAVGVGLAAIMLVGFYWAQRRGGHRFLQSAIGRLTGDRKWRMLGTIRRLSAFDDDLRGLPDLAASCVVHMAAGSSAWPRF
jgi:hypothetical protein